jgi:hypothetical protein
MIRICTATALTLMILMMAGCFPTTPGLVSMPGGKGTSYTVQSGGHYILYHATKRIKNEAPDPKATTQVASFDLRTGDTVGFEWVTNKAHEYDPDAHIDLFAYAGSHRINLGGLKSQQEVYYWSNANGDAEKPQ